MKRRLLPQLGERAIAATIIDGDDLRRCTVFLPCRLHGYRRARSSCVAPYGSSAARVDPSFAVGEPLTTAIPAPGNDPRLRIGDECRGRSRLRSRPASCQPNLARPQLSAGGRTTACGPVLRPLRADLSIRKSSSFFPLPAGLSDDDNAVI